MLNKTIKSLIENHDVISFDIFDTLLKRPYINPYHLLDHVERYMGADGFAKNRFNAEGLARQKSQKEDITIDDIYDNVDEKFKYLFKTELCFEEKLCRKKELGYEIYKYSCHLNKKIVFISDTYLPKNFLKKLLNKNGYNTWDFFYLSNEYGLAKYTGNLFKKFLKDTHFKPSTILHIGDSLESDIKMPSKYKINTYHIPKDSDIFFSDRHNKVWKSLYKKNQTLEISIILSMIVEYYTKNKQMLKNKLNYWYDFGYIIAAPIGLAFIMFILDKINSYNIEEVLLVARDGYVLKKILDKFLEGSNVKTYYIYAQRILRARILLDYGDEHNADLLLSILDEQIPRIIKLENFKEKEEYIAKNIDKLSGYADKKKQEYQQYLFNQGIDKNKKIALIDTGAATFSAQQIVQTALQRNIIGLYTIITNPQYANKKKLNYEVWSENIDVVKNITSIIEFCFTSPEPPIVDLVANKPIYTHNPNINELYRNSLCPSITNGILDFISDYKNKYCDFNIMFSANETNKYVYYFIKYLSKIDKQMLGKIKCPSNSSHTQYKQNLLADMKKSISESNSIFNRIFSIKKESNDSVNRIKIKIFNIKIQFKL